MQIVLLVILMLSGELSILRVVVVDDHELTRLTLQLTFSSQENIQVVGIASNGKEAIEIVKYHHPDVIILDLQMPIMDGWNASNHIKAISPQTQILAYSSVEDSYIQAEKSFYSFDDVCDKDIPATELIALVRQMGQHSLEQRCA